MRVDKHEKVDKQVLICRQTLKKEAEAAYVCTPVVLHRISFEPSFTHTYLHNVHLQILH